eukprot:snap_masked-scaffold_14-processed-gene-2.24-mRNA-1 protein AED:0.96 eAED:1.00 QI:0/0/0/0.5/1/1/2/0/387
MQDHKSSEFAYGVYTSTVQSLHSTTPSYNYEHNLDPSFASTLQVPTPSAMSSYTSSINQNQSKMSTPNSPIPPIQVMSPTSAYSLEAKKTGHPLHFLKNVQKLRVKQNYEAFESAANAAGCDCIESKNQYEVFNDDTSEQLLHVREHSTFCMRCCCKPNHEATIMFHDVSSPLFNPEILDFSNSAVVMRMNKPWKLNCCACTSFFQQEQETFIYPGKKVGSAIKTNPCLQRKGCFSPNFEIANSNGKNIAEVRGPLCCVGGMFEFLASIKYEVFALSANSASEQKLANILKAKPEGKDNFKEVTGDSDQFYLELDQNELQKVTNSDDEKIELIATFLSTLILLDYVFYEAGPPVRYSPIDGSFSVNCFEYYFCGCVCTWKAKFGGSK